MNISKRPQYITVADSGTVVVRGIASMLKGDTFDPFLSSPTQRLGATMCNALPVNLRKRIMEAMSESIGVKHEMADHVSSDSLTDWIISEYPAVKYKTVIIGAPSGGVSYLASLLNAPFLTQHFLIGFKGKYAIDNSKCYFNNCSLTAEKILSNNPDLAAIIHYDPLHDRFIVKKIGFIRLKLLNLHQNYKNFIESNLEPDGTIVFVGCQYPWLQYRISRRFYFQLGGLGGVSTHEYYSGSERIEKYINSERSFSEMKFTPVNHRNWLLDNYEPEMYPESEWGLLPSFADDIRSYASSNNYRLIEINLDHPDQLSKITFNAFNDLIRRENPDVPPRIVMDSFTNSSPIFSRQISAKPLWLPFICNDSYEFATKILDHEPDHTEIFLALHPSFSNPFDLVHFEKWQQYLSRFKKLHLVGINPNKYPEDLSAYFRFTSDTIRYSSIYNYPLKGTMMVEDLQTYINSLIPQI